jgi:hypothetical protein
MMSTLTDEVLSSKTFIDWTRIYAFAEDYRRELALVGSLSKETPVEDLADLLVTYPRVLPLLRSLIASAERLALIDGFTIDFKADQSRVTTGDKNRALQIATCFEAIGLLRELMVMKSVLDYSKGVLVGLEPNKHKNRRGSAFQSQVGALVRTTVDEISVTFQPKLQVGEGHGLEVKIGRRKYPDFGVLAGSPAKLEIAIEANFYASSGSKPLETLTSAYPEVQRQLANLGISLIVITDGMGWKRMKPSLAVALDSLHYLMNFTLAGGGAT